MADISGPFAEVSDLEARWRTLSDDEKRTAQTLLEDATGMMLAAAPDCVSAVSASELRRICCRMVRDAMATGSLDAPSGVSQTSETVGPFSHSFTFESPNGRLYLTRLERRELTSGNKAFSVEMGG